MDKMKLLDGTKATKDNQMIVFMPNEIFTDLTINVNIKQPNIGLSYSYYFLCTYLYQYQKHINDHCQFFQPNMKDFLGYNPINKKIDYLIKKGGVLDEMGYTETTWEYPLPNSFYNDDYTGFEFEFPEKPLGSFSIKKPVKAFHRSQWSRDKGIYDGTFYELENTHAILVDAFVKAMEDEEIGVTGFYIYAYIRKMNDYYGGAYCQSYEGLCDELKISKRTLNRYIKGLEGAGMLGVYHQDYHNNPEHHANEYTALMKPKLNKTFKRNTKKTHVLE